VSGGDIPPPWLLFPALKEAFFWVGHNQFGLSQAEAERLWPVVFAELQGRPSSWRLHLSPPLQDKRLKDERLSSWAHLEGPDWDDGTVRTPTWNQFMAMSSADGDRMLEAWGLSFSEHGYDLRGVFDKRLKLEASRDDMRDLLEWELVRQQAMRPPRDPPPQPVGAPPNLVFHTSEVRACLALDAEPAAVPKQTLEPPEWSAAMRQLVRKLKSGDAMLNYPAFWTACNERLPQCTDRAAKRLYAVHIKSAKLAVGRGAQSIQNEHRLKRGQIILEKWRLNRTNRTKQPRSI
jgi:hypothetical protein